MRKSMHRYLAYPQQKILFSPIPKLMLRANGIEPKWGAINSKSYNTFGLVPMINRGDIRESDIHDYWSFAVVRNPYTRVVSAYVDKFIKHNMVYDGTKVVADATGQLYPTFQSFVRYLSRTNPEALDEHWRPQQSFLDGFTFDFIGRFEQYGEVMDRLFSLLGIEPTDDHWNKTEYRGSETPEAHTIPCNQFGDKLPSAADLYTEELREIVRAVYKRDFTLYYSSELS